jgi:hypothetical protein
MLWVSSLVPILNSADNLSFGAVIDEQYFNFLVEQFFNTSNINFQTLA